MLFPARNTGYRHSLTAFEDWEKAQTFEITSESSESDDNDKDKDGDNDTGKAIMYLRPS